MQTEITIPSWRALNTLNASPQTLQYLTREPITEMSEEDAADRQRVIAQQLELLATTYITLTDADMPLPAPWDDRMALSRLVHEVMMYLGHPTGFRWAPAEQERAYWYHVEWQHLLSIYSDTLPTTKAPSAVPAPST